jgi:hypothetical protein
VHKTKRRAKAENTNPNSSARSAGRKLSLRVCLPADRVPWSGKGTPMSDATLKYPLWQNHYLRAMAETHPEQLKSKISAAEQVVSLRLKQLAITTDDYEEQIALAAALKSLKVLKER